MVRRRTPSALLIAGALLAAGCTGGEDTAATSSTSAEPDDEDAAPADDNVTTSTAPDLAAIRRPDIEPLNCGALLDIWDTDIALGLLDLPMNERSAFTFAQGEYCNYQWAEDPERSVRIEPGLPPDTEPGAVLLDVSGEPVSGVGDAAAWFGSGDEGLLAVEALTALGQLNFRLILSRPDIGPDERRAVAIEVALIVLPRFPGVESPPPPERDLAALRGVVDRSADGWTELLDAGVADDRWDPGDGLLKLLEAATDASNELGEQFDGFAQSATGIVARARSYLADPDDPAVGDELADLLDATFPSRERLARAELIPATTTTTTTTTTTAPVTSTTTGSPSGFRRAPDPEGPCEEPAPNTNQCLLTINLPELDGAYGEQKYLLFVPASNDDPDGFLGWSNDQVGRVVEAMTTSAQWFEARGKMPTTSVMLAGDGNAPTMSDVEPSLCTIVVMTPIQSYNEGQFKQFIAGQMAHCFNAATFTSGADGSYDASRWWSAGSAIWLSSEIYPDANLEWVHLPKQLTFHELQTSILERGQTNGMWFQHLRWEYGIDQLITLISTLQASTGGDAAALAGWPEMRRVFHDYAHSLSDLGVPDAGQDQLAGFYDVPADLVEIDAPTSDFVNLDAFRVSRIEYQVLNGDVACIEGEATGGAKLTWREGGPEETGNWSEDVPSTLSGTAIFAGSSLEDGGAIRITVNDVVDDPDDCEPESDDGSAGGGDDCQLDCGSSEYYSEP